MSNLMDDNKNKPQTADKPGSSKTANSLENFLVRIGFGMKAKLIIIFVAIKVIPLVLLTWLAWRQTGLLGVEVSRLTSQLVETAHQSLSNTGEIAVNDAVDALNARAVEDIERMTTDLALDVAKFLYKRDDDILQASKLRIEEGAFRAFLNGRSDNVVKPGKWRLADDGKSWIPEHQPEPRDTMKSTNKENDLGFRYRAPTIFDQEKKLLFREMTFVDIAGQERVKVTTSDVMDPEMKDVSIRENTFVKAENYFEHLKKLKPREIYVSDVIGAYVPSKIIGMYTPENAQKLGIPYAPQDEAYAGTENPNGRRFQGIVRWATPVMDADNNIIGYVTLALDHDHLMEFTSHIIPTNKRYVELPSAYEGNYAFIWDYKCRSIVHPRHHSICGYDPETGEPQIPWLEDRIYNDWKASGKSLSDFLAFVPTFDAQSVLKKPAPELTKAGLVGLDGRYLNNAPQCTGWFDLTRDGGSGSFHILWSGLRKITTAAAIPYYTGQYSPEKAGSKRGFGFVSIGAELDDFYRPAMETKEVLDKLVEETDTALTKTAEATNVAIERNLINTTTQLVFSAAVMVIIVVFIAIWMASVFTKSITNMINGISRFRGGERHFRFNAPVKDEIGTLADSFDDMADSLEASVTSPLSIIDMNRSVIYMNSMALVSIKKKRDDIIGKSYNEFSLYPPLSPYDPVLALDENREAEILYLPDLDKYIRGSASYLLDKAGQKIGYIVISTDITEIIKERNVLMKTQVDLKRAVEEANKANASKGDFLARMSHEIRTPMNAIMGVTNIVKRKLAEYAAVIGGKLMGVNEDMMEIQSHVRQIETSSQHLLGLLNDILDLSKIDAGKIELTEETVDIEKLVVTVGTIIRPRCEEKNIVFNINCDIDAPAAFVSDSLRLRQVLINLLGNAVKFTPECGVVELDISQKAKENGKTLVQFIIRDTGIGIAEDVLPKLFKAFEQGGADMSRKHGGAGLGLAISQRIIQLFGGEIKVQSQSGKGSVFEFNLWLKDAAAEESIIDEMTDVDNIFLNKKCLLVDDVAINRMIAVDFLSLTGMKADEADDGAEAVEMFKNSPLNTYDIVYMDIQMPNMNGYEAALALRALDRDDAKTVPIIALTANAFKDDIDKAFASGMNGHTSKPLEFDTLIGLTTKFLGKNS
ncbi:hypothetical protein AGMMS49957_06790 [Synergistales bacterium]|nr:hypothetical protein AGMMS49957_06790 [Synergistales bacterium]